MPSRYIPDEIREQIRSRAEITDVIGSYVQLKRAGANRMKGLCPFHNEKTPSFVVSSDRQTFHCFGCQKGGDVFRFIMEKENIDFPNAVHMLAEKYNVEIPEEKQQHHTAASGDPQRPRINKERLYTLNEQLAAFYEKTLHDNPDSEVAKYLHSRAIPGEIIANFRIGAAPDDWHGAHNHFMQQGYSQDELTAAGILVTNDSGNVYDRFRNRLMFTIWNEQGRIVGFSGRSVEENPQGGKYVNTPETPLFTKSRILYALPLARNAIKEKGFAIIAEGQLDTIAFHRAGFENAVAPQGTAFTDEQVRILKRYTEQVVIAFDSDEPGQKATERSIQLMLPTGFDIKVIQMPPKSDPDAIFTEKGAAGIEELLQSAITFFDFIFMRSASRHDVTTPWGKSKITDEVLKYIAMISAPVLRSTYSSQLAHKLALPENAVFQSLNKLRKYDKFRNTSGPVNAIPPPVPAEISGEAVQTALNIPKAVLKAELGLLELSLAHGTYGKQLAEALPERMISKTTVGKALNLVISMTVNGEWEFAEETLRAQLAESPSPEISSILTTPSFESDTPEKTHEMQEKAFTDCLATIMNYFRKLEINELTAKLAAARGEEKQKLLVEYQNKIQKK